MNKIIKTLVIIFLMILVLFVGTLLFLLMTEKLDFSKTELVYDRYIEETFDSMEISTNSLDVRIVKSNDEKVNVKIYDREKENTIIKVENNKLIIKSENKNLLCFLCYDKRRVIISVPQKEYNLVLNTSSGDIISELDLNNTTISVTSGDIYLKKVNEFTMSSTSGDVKIEEVNNINANLISGDIIIGKINNSLDIKTASGNINIGTLTITKDSTIKATSGDITIYKSSNNTYFDANTTSGDIKISNNNRKSEYKLKIKTKSGDIKVK